MLLHRGSSLGLASCNYYIVWPNLVHQIGFFGRMLLALLVNLDIESDSDIKNFSPELILD